jgi:hypothetical protein
VRRRTDFPDETSNEEGLTFEGSVHLALRFVLKGDTVMHRLSKLRLVLENRLISSLWSVTIE